MTPRVPLLPASAVILAAFALLSAFAAPGASAFAPPRFLPSSPALPSVVDADVATDAADVPAATAEATSSAAAAEGGETKKRLAVLLCPAQFCVPVDYDDLLDDVRRAHPTADVVAARAAPLPRTEWIKVARQLPTKDFVDANLSVKKTLDWYFDAIEEGLAELFAEGGEDVEVCVIGHSIGGWVARAYLGGLSGSSTAVYRLARERVTSLVTLGTPHTSPASALVDQTRGLLREIASSPDCSSRALSDRGIRITCVGGSGLGGRLLTTDVEELVAATSYLPLVGRLGDDVRGDGIVPTDLAFMEAPARRVEIERCSATGGAVRHAHVLPTPWNLIDGGAPSIRLPEGIVWYGSSGVLGQWLEYVG